MYFMSYCLLFFTVYVFFIPGLEAADTCSSTVPGYIRNVDVSKVANAIVGEKNHWVVLTTKTYAPNTVSQKLTFGQIKQDSSYDYNISTVFPDGSSARIQVHVVKRQNFLTETEPDGVYQSHPFVCGGRIFGEYRCKYEGVLITTWWLVFASEKYDLQVLQQDLATCKALLVKIAPNDRFTELKKP